MSLLKPSLLVVSAVCYQAAIGHPTPLLPEDRVAAKSTRERIWISSALPCSLFLKGTVYLAAAAESLAALGSSRDTRRSSDSLFAIILNALESTEADRVTIPFALGASLVIASAILRVQCFRALGPFFTYMPCIRKDHQLVTTGPYAVVRHPGYASLLGCFLGVGIMHGTPGSWLRASGVLRVPWVRAVCVGWGAITLASAVTICIRPTEEDQILSERFGKEWDNWAERVKYKLIPFVY